MSLTIGAPRLLLLRLVSGGLSLALAVLVFYHRFRGEGEQVDFVFHLGGGIVGDYLSFLAAWVPHADDLIPTRANKLVCLVFSQHNINN